MGSVHTLVSIWRRNLRPFPEDTATGPEYNLLHTFDSQHRKCGPDVVFIFLRANKFMPSEY